MTSTGRSVESRSRTGNDHWCAVGLLPNQTAGLTLPEKLNRPPGRSTRRRPSRTRREELRVSQTIRNQVIARLTAPDGPFPVETAVVRGVTYRVHANSPANLREVFSSGAQWGDRKAVTYEDENYTWTEYLGIV